MTNKQAARENMISSQLLPNEVTDERILSAIRSVDRTFFVPEIFAGVAYADDDIPLAPHRWMLKPMLFARLLQLADISADSKMLYIGAGSGYGVAVAARLAKQVVAVECLRELADVTRHNLLDLHIDVEIFCSPLTVGYPLSAPYDIIFIEGAVQQVPHGLADQLNESGRIVAVQNLQQRLDEQRGLGRAFVAQKVNGALHQKFAFDATAALLPGFEARKDFIF